MQLDRPLETGAKAQPPSLALRVVTLHWEAAGIVSVVLASDDGAALPAWAPGAHVDVELAPGLLRQYSLSGDPADSSSYRITVALEHGGRGGSKHVHERLRVGEILKVSAPRSTFPFVDAPRYVFLAGGIGITPLLPMMRRAAAEGRPWVLHLAVRSRHAIPFRDELGDGNGTGTVHVFASDEGQRLDLRDAVARAHPSAAVYCCGPERMLVEVEQHARDLGREVRVERFQAKPLSEPLRQGSFVVRCARSQQSMTVEPDQSVLDALASVGIDLPSSCREGVCGTCELAVLNGVVDHRDSILTDAEKQANDTMMVCVSRALTEELELDV
ncbi:PDR/VanB family oxidoreductase [Microbispora sp. CA-102843]|uniref:PDR/VanB family oxidoreductase n=1 Tax=Microbispora sp. CA-102843 TaxID=3239952 RepID=UPI003D89FEC5